MAGAANSAAQRGGPGDARAAGLREPQSGATGGHLSVIPFGALPRAAPVDGQFRALPCRATPRFRCGTTPSTAATKRSAKLSCRSACASAAAHPNRQIPRDAAGRLPARFDVPDYAWPRAARTSCRSRGLGERRCRWAGRTPRSARCGATGANEKRMKIHPFSVALRLWGRRLALATESSPVASLRPFPHCRGLRQLAQTERAIRSPTLDGEALAALRATCVDDLTATSGLHANAEAVGALATGNGRLVSTFHVALT
jgi:hypothetical protein